MNIFSKKPLKNIELLGRDPKTLDFDTLHHQRAALVAQLLVVSENLQARYDGIARTSSESPDVKENSQFFEQCAKDVNAFNAILRAEFTKLTANLKTSN